MDWTEGMEARLRTLWDRPELSTAAIGREMGLGKNAIVGKARRMRLPGRPSPIKGGARSEQAQERRRRNLAEATRLRGLGYSGEQISRQLGLHRDTVTQMLRVAGMGGKQAQPRVLPARVVPVVVAPAAPPVPVAAHPLMRAGASGCRWPIGEPRKPGFRFCEATNVVAGRPYCPEHCAKAFDRPLVSGLAMAPRGWAA